MQASSCHWTIGNKNRKKVKRADLLRITAWKCLPGGNVMASRAVVASYLLAVIAIPLVLNYHLLPAVFAGLAVHVLTVKLARALPANWGGLTHKLALAALAIIVILGLFGICIGLWSFLSGSGGMAALLATVAETLKKLHHTLPESLGDALPMSVEELREPLSEMLREHGQKISAAGLAGAKTFAHIVLGMLIGGMTALHHFTDTEQWPPFSAALHARTKALAEAFDKVVFAQVKISALNTLLTALYLLVILPLCGIRLPLLTVLIPLTFVTGLLPVIGNLISNIAIVMISFGVSPGVAISSLVFLVLIHKLEYFTNAKIVGGEVHARAWELLCAMLFMEALFGVTGLIAAPVVYAWMKSEIKERHLI
jgi:predicted PurR-regulated permease PerM